MISTAAACTTYARLSLREEWVASFRLYPGDRLFVRLVTYWREEGILERRDGRVNGKIISKVATNCGTPLHLEVYPILHLQCRNSSFDLDKRGPRVGRYWVKFHLSHVPLVPCLTLSQNRPDTLKEAFPLQRLGTGTVL